MIQIRRAGERGHANHGWLDTFHTFSFADYHDPAHMGFRSLRVINEDRVEPGQGFGTHPHRDMEIITYVLEGELTHQDSMGNGSVIRPGEVQRMSAGTGVTHSEYNHSKTNLVHLLQIWILPEKSGLKPGYEQRVFGKEDKANRFHLVASGKNNEVVKVHQDVELFVGLLDKSRRTEHRMGKGRYAWIQVARGTIVLNGDELRQGDGAAVSGESLLTVEAKDPSEVLLFDLN